MPDIPRLFSVGSPSSNALLFFILQRKNNLKLREVFLLCKSILLAAMFFTSSFCNTCLLAFFFCLEAVVISTTATIPELRTRIRLLIIVPVDFILAAGALFQCEETAGINSCSLCREKDEMIFRMIFITCLLDVFCFKHVSTVPCRNTDEGLIKLS